MSEHCLDDGFATIRGPRRVRAYPKAGAPVHQSETPQAQISLQFDGMFAAGLIPLRIVGEVDVPHAELTGYEGNHGRRRLFGPMPRPGYRRRHNWTANPSRLTERRFVRTNTKSS